MSTGRRTLLYSLVTAAVGSSRVVRAAASALEVPGPPPSPGSAPARPVVARARREGMLPAQGPPDRRKLADALGAAVARAAGEAGPVEGFRKLFRPSDVVGIKLNCIAGKGLSPRPEVVELLCGWLQAAGVPARNILAWDRTDRELAAAGFTLRRGRVCPTGFSCRRFN